MCSATFQQMKKSKNTTIVKYKRATTDMVELKHLAHAQNTPQYQFSYSRKYY